MPDLSDAPRMYRTLRRLLPHVVNPYFPLTVLGLENVPCDRPAILAANHLSFVDSIVLPINVPRPVYFLGKSDYWDSWRTRWFFTGTGVVPVYRDGGDRGAASLRAGVEILRQGDLLGIYPEGTRSPDGRLYRGKTGPARMALAAEVEIVPCAVLGSDIGMPTGTRWPRRMPITVHYGEPMSLAAYTGRENDPGALRDATREIMQAIQHLSGQEYVDMYAETVKGVARRSGPSSTGVDAQRRRERRAS
ncbi:MAG: lysophospholipid acyltransferase family protein [Nitriliruptoraceae bacterium]